MGADRDGKTVRALSDHTERGVWNHMRANSVVDIGINHSLANITRAGVEHFDGYGRMFSENAGKDFLYQTGEEPFSYSDSDFA